MNQNILQKLSKIPKNLNKSEGLCYYGKLNEYEKYIFNQNNFIVEETEKFTNIYFTKSSNLEIFENYKNYKYLDGFSPNLNKELHIGHFSNLILAKAFQRLNIAKYTISLFGDTLKHDGLDNKIGLKLIKKLISNFEYYINYKFFASKMKWPKEALSNGNNDYEGTKIIRIKDNFQVMVKKDNSTSYIYHDLSLAKLLDAETLYLTGYEQKEHFEKIKFIFPTVNHLGLGLVKLLNSKMSSREGNVIFIKDLLLDLNNTFNNSKLSYNVFAGYILKSNPSSDKNIDLKTITNYKNSLGLYLSYTTARFLKAGCYILPIRFKYNKILEYDYIQSKNNLNPSILFNSIIEYCKELNQLYENNRIKGSIKNRIKLSIKLTELNYYLKKLGLYTIKKV